MTLKSSKLKLCFSLLCLLFIWDSATAAEDSKIYFPEDDHLDSCFLNGNQRTPGVCLEFEDCPEALEEWKQSGRTPQRCYLDGFKEFVCCVKSKKQQADLRIKPSRRSATGCEMENVVPDANRKKKPKPNRGGVVHIEAIGVSALKNEFPYMAALGWTSTYTDGITYSCGGVLFYPGYILTAAHCLNLNGAAPKVVRLGDNPLSTSTERQVFPIKRIIPHPQYMDGTAYYDIAIIELQGDTSGHKAACLWLDNIYPVKNVTAIGYGHTKFGGPSSNDLIKADLFLNTNAECSRFYPPNEDLPRGLMDSQICAGNPVQRFDTCQGDSGGPMIMRVPKENSWLNSDYVVGLTSLGAACGGTTPSIYTKVSEYIDWIENVLFP